MWGCLPLAGLLLAGCSFSPGGSSGSDPDSDDGDGFSDGLPDPDGSPGLPDATPPPPDGPPVAPVLLETLTIQATGEVVTSSVVLSADASYTLVASGEVVVNDDGFSADSDYWWDDGIPGLGFDGFDGVDYGLAINDLDVDGTRSPDWGEFSPDSHSYQTTMPGTDGVLTAQFHDRDYDNGNSGSLSLEIWGPPP